MYLRCCRYILTVKVGESGNAIFNRDGVDDCHLRAQLMQVYQVAEAAAKHIIPLTLDFDRDKANIIVDDANFRPCIEGIQLDLFNQGKVCGAGSQLFIMKLL